jgi:hypothetical protein
VRDAEVNGVAGTNVVGDGVGERHDLRTPSTRHCEVAVDPSTKLGVHADVRLL